MITKRIIDQHSGVIYIKEDQNTCFAVRLKKETYLKNKLSAASQLGGQKAIRMPEYFSPLF